MRVLYARPPRPRRHRGCDARLYRRARPRHRRRAVARRARRGLHAGRRRTAASTSTTRRRRAGRAHQSRRAGDDSRAARVRSSPMRSSICAAWASTSASTSTASSRRSSRRSPAPASITGHRVRTAPGVYVRLADPGGPRDARPGGRPRRPRQDRRARHQDPGGHRAYHAVALNVAMDLAPFERIDRVRLRRPADRRPALARRRVGLGRGGGALAAALGRHLESR